MSNVEEAVREIAERVARSFGLEVWDVELRGSGGKARMLRIFIDKPSDPKGPNLEDCENVSREVGTILDIEDPIKGSYTLEVSSPGLDRKLRNAGDYERFRGSLVKIQTLEPVNGTRNLEGRLQEVNDGRMTLELPAKGKGKKAVSGGTVEIKVSNVAKGNLVPEF
jgi:ribosome maturation factor RimP